MRTVAALYDSRAEAESARSRLLAEAGARSPRILARDTVGALEGLNIPAAAAATYRESLRQGCHLVVAEVPRGSDPKRIIELLQQATSAGANDQADNSWGNGEQGIHVELPGDARSEAAQDAMPERPAEPPALPEPSALPEPQVERAAQEAVAALPEPEITAPIVPLEEERIPVVEEDLRVGKRRIVAAGPRLRALTVEGPAEEEVSLTDEFVDVESRPIQRELSESEVKASGLFTDRVFEVAEMREEPVVTKTAIVREEVIIRKRVSEHVETVRDTVRHTEIEVEDLPAPAEVA